MNLRTPLKTALGLGSAKDGTHHWWAQRVTAIALVPLTLWITFTVASMSSQSHAAVLAYFQAPFNIAMFSLFIIAAFYHAILGLQVVIEDYVHHEGIKLAAMLVMKLGLILLGAVSLFAVLRAAFGS